MGKESGALEGEILIIAVVVVGLALFFDFSNGFHDAANVVATIIVTGAMSPAKALTIASICEFIGPFLFGTAVAKTIGKNIIDTAAFDPTTMALSAGLIVAALIGAIAWNLITWWFGLPSSSSHALIGGLIGPVLIAYGPDKILWQGVIFVFASLILSPVIGMFFGWLFYKITRFIAEESKATPSANLFFNRMQIVSSICLALSHGANDAQKSMGVITMSLVILKVFPSFEIPFLGDRQLRGRHRSRLRHRRMADHQDHGIEDLPAAIGARLLLTDGLRIGDPDGGVFGRAGFHDPCRLVEHHRGGSRTAGVFGALGCGKGYRHCLVHHHPRIGCRGIPGVSRHPGAASVFLNKRKEPNHGIQHPKEDLLEGEKCILRSPDAPFCKDLGGPRGIGQLYG